MKSTYNLNNLDELKAMRSRLNAQQSVMGKDIVSKAKAGLVVLPVASLLKPSDPLKVIKIDGKINVSGKVFSYLFPLIVNKILFKRSGFVKRIIIAMIARRVGQRIGPKITTWLISMAKKYVAKCRSKAVLLPGSVLQQKLMPSRRMR